MSLIWLAGQKQTQTDRQTDRQTDGLDGMYIAVTTATCGFSFQFIPGSILFNCVDTLLNGSHLCCLLNVHALLVNVGRYLCQENVVSKPVMLLGLF